MAFHPIGVLRQAGGGARAGIFLVARPLDPDLALSVGLRGRRRLPHPIDEAGGQDLRAVPDAALQQELAEARPVVRGGVEVGRADESALLVGLEHRAVHAERLEQRRPRPCQRLRPVADSILP